MVISASRREAALEERLLLFFALSAAGWIWEVLLTVFTTGQWVNRGMLHGPWLPVYGVGGVLLLAAIGRCRWKYVPPLLGALLGGAVEYGTALILELRFRQRWWDYTGQWGSLQGRVCLTSLAGFALAGWALKRLAPAFRRQVGKWAPAARTRLCRAVSILLALDWALSLLLPNTGAGITCPP